MNKNEFLKELKKHLSILEDGEQNDILEEYAQHIGMKISSGLSEEEAIRDFGNIKELAAQILEAYHVNPGYRKKRQEDIAEEGKKIWGSVKESARRIGRCILKNEKGKRKASVLFKILPGQKSYSERKAGPCR